MAIHGKIPGEVTKAGKRSHYLLLSLSEVDGYTDKMVGKVLTLLETIIENKQRLESAKSVARDYLYNLNKELHQSINEMMTDEPSQVDRRVGDSLYSLPFGFGWKETLEQREKQIEEIKK